MTLAIQKSLHPIFGRSPVGVAALTGDFSFYANVI